MWSAQRQSFSLPSNSARFFRARIFQIDGGRADVANWRTRGAEDGSRIRRLSETFNKAGDFEVEPNSLVRRAIVPRVRSASRSRRAK
jgi:hypothetical protein